MYSSIVGQIADLQTLSLPDLRERWRALFGTDPPGYSREHLVRRLAYRVQELPYGGLPAATRAKLRDLVPASERLGPDGTLGPLKSRKREDGMPVVGTRLIREWHGARHEVTVVQGGFDYGGVVYRSLSAVAKAITRQHWNGRLFFGLCDRKGKA